MTDGIPDSVRKAAEVASLPAFLEQVAAGFHWDILDRLEDGVYLMDCDRRVVYWSAGAERITGYVAEEALGSRCSDNLLRHVDESGQPLCETRCPMQAVMQDGMARAADVYLHHKEGHRVAVRVYGAPIRNMDGEIIGAFETFSETTSLLAPLEHVRKLKEIAYVDELTQIANRRLLNREIENCFSGFHRENWTFGFILMDIDHFKKFNDTYGHETGDRVLRVVAETLAHACRPYDLVGRWGGEEFLMVVSRVDAATLHKIAERLRGLVAASSLDIDGQRRHVTVSAGAALVRPDDDASTLLGRVDELLYLSKRNGRDCVTIEVETARAAIA